MTTSNTYTFSDKWSPQLQSDGFTAIPNTLIKNQSKLRITDPEMVVIVSLLSFKWSRQMPYPSVATLSSFTGKTAGAVRGNLRNLEKKGLIKRVYRESQTNKYDLSPLVKALDSYTQAIKKSTHPSRKLNTSPYQRNNTKEYAANNTKTRTRSGFGGKPVSIGELLNRRHPL